MFNNTPKDYKGIEFYLYKLYILMYYSVLGDS